MKPYHPSGRIPIGGLIGVLLVTIIGSLVIGGLVFAVSHMIYLVILFPLMMGAFLGGALLALTVKNGKVRSSLLAGLFGMVIGVGMIGVNRFAEYVIDFHNQARMSSWMRLVVTFRRIKSTNLLIRFWKRKRVLRALLAT